MALSIKKQLSAAQEFERQGKSAEASQTYREILNQSSGNAAALHGLAVLAFNANHRFESRGSTFS